MNLLILCPKYIMWERKIQELRTQVGKIKPWKLYMYTRIVIKMYNSLRGDFWFYHSCYKTNFIVRHFEYFYPLILICNIAGNVSHCKISQEN